MNEARYEARQRKTEAQMVLAGQFTTAVKDLVVASLSNPAISATLAVALVELLARYGYINNTERGALAAVMVSAPLLEAFKPLQLKA